MDLVNGPSARLACILAALTLAGCWPEDRFREEADLASCEWMADCMEDVDMKECLEDAKRAWTPVDDDCTYSPRHARKCVHQIERLECPTDSDGGGVPEECDLVWDCPLNYG
jgi:hypothetical protein